MTSKELLDRLQTLDEQLNHIRQQLIRCEPPNAQFAPLLENVVEVLKAARNQAENALEDKSFQQVLKSVRDRTIRVKNLLNSAMNLHEGIGCWPQMAVSYGSDGRLLSIKFGGQIRVQA